MAMKVDPLAAFDAAAADPLAAFDAAVAQPAPAAPVAARGPAPTVADSARASLAKRGLTPESWRARMDAGERLAQERIAMRARRGSIGLSQEEIDRITLEAQRDAAAGRTTHVANVAEAGKAGAAGVAGGFVDATLGTAGLAADVFRVLNSSPVNRVQEPLKYTTKATEVADAASAEVKRATNADPLADYDVGEAMIRMAVDVGTPLPGIDFKIGRGATKDAVAAFDEAVKAAPSPKPHEPKLIGTTLSAESLEKTFGLRKEEATAAEAIADAMGLDKSRISVVKGGEVGDDALKQAAETRWYYDNVAASLDNWQAKGTPEQLLAHLKKSKGATEEADTIGLTEWLKGKKSVTKDEVAEFVAENKIDIEDVTRRAFTQEELDDARLAAKMVGGKKAEAWREMQRTQQPKFQDYTIPGGENYREVLLTLPSKPDVTGDSMFRVKDPDGAELQYANLEAAERAARESGGRVLRPDRETYQSPHWSEPNVLAHVRLNDRTLPDGRKILFVEEIQSDWHQAGRKNGYRDPNKVAALKAAEDRANEIGRRFIEARGQFVREHELNPHPDPLRGLQERLAPIQREVDAAQAEVAKLREEAGGWGSVPDAPFKGEGWKKLALKRILADAADKGYDGIAWTNGEMQAARYDLSKHVDNVAYESGLGQDGELLYSVEVRDKQGKIVFDEEEIPIERIEEVLGKELAQKIADDAGTLRPDQPYREWRDLSGLDLKVGGEGMRGFYDRELPNLANDLGKKYGARVERVDIAPHDKKALDRAKEALNEALRAEDFLGFDTAGAARAAILEDPDFAARWEMEPPTIRRAREWRDLYLRKEATEATQGQPVHFLPTPPEMRETIKQSRLPLFQAEAGAAKGAVEFTEGGQAIIRALQSPDASTAAHELAHVSRRFLFDRDIPLEQRLGISDDDIKIAEEWAGATDGKWTKDAEEKFARGFERYLFDGVAPTEKLAAIFDKFKQWLGRIYKQVTGSSIDIEISPEMRKVFDNLVTRGEKTASAAKPLNLTQGLPLPTGRHTFPMTVESNAGVEAVRSLAGQKELDSLVAMPIDDLRRTLEQKGVRGLPDAKDPKYRGKSYEAKRDMIAAYGQHLARKAGHDEILMTNPLKPDVSERIPISAEEPEIGGPPAKRADVVQYEEPPNAGGGGAGAPPRRPRQPRIGGEPPSERPALPEYFDHEAYADEMVRKREAARGGKLKQDTLQVLREAKARFVDSVSPIEDAVRGLQPPTAKQTAEHLLGTKALSGDVEVPFDGIKPSEDIRNAIDSAIMSGEKAGQFLRDNGFDKLVKSAKNIGHFEQFASAKHAITLFYQRWGKQIDRATPDRAKRLAAIYERRFGRDLWKDGQMVKAFEAEYDGLATQLNAYSHKVLDYSVDAGLVSPELAEHLKVIYPYYVPLKRVFSVLEETANEGTRGVASLSKQTVVRKFVGSKRELESPLTAMIEKTYDAFAQGERSKAGRMLTEQMQLRELKNGERAAHTVSFLDNGKKRTFEAPAEIAAAAKSLNVEQISLLGRILAVPARVLKVGATGLNMAFLAKNPVRDVLTAVINSREGRKVIKEMWRGIFEAVNHGKLYDEILREGGMFTSFDQFRVPKQETLASIRGERAVGESNIKYTVRRASEMFRAVEDIVARGEQATRIAAYSAAKKKALAQGLSEAEARLAGKQASLWTTGPFHRQGEWGRVLRASAPYLNAGIQGQRVTVAALRTRPVQTFGKIAVTTMFPVAIATAWNLSDPERKKAYDDIADFEKENSFIIVPPNPTKDEKGLWNTIKIPLPQSVAKWTTLLRRPIESAYDLDPVKALEVAQALLGTVSPVASVNEIGANVVPQAVRPALEVSVNRNFFAQREIEPSHMQDRPASQRVFRQTSGSARLLGKISGLSPLQVEHLIRGYTAGVGQQAVNGVDRVLAAIGVIPKSQIGGEGPIDMTTRGFAKAIPTPPREKRDKSRRRARERGRE